MLRRQKITVAYISFSGSREYLEFEFSGLIGISANAMFYRHGDYNLCIRFEQEKNPGQN